MTLKPASELARLNRTTFPNESDEYRRARQNLLIAEIELRRQIERVAEIRRKLPLGGEVSQDFEFISESGPVRFADLFGEKSTLILYSYMFGPQRTEPCPMCTSFMATWAKKILDLEQRVSIAFVARSPISRQLDLKNARGWTHHRLLEDREGAYTRAYVSAEDDDMPAYNVFTRRDGRIYHFWSAEMGMETADPGQDPRGAPDIDPLWTILDTTPEGRGPDWYPKLHYS